MTREYQRPMLQPTASFDWIIGSDEPGAAHRIAHGDTQAADPEVVDRVVQLAAGSGIDGTGIDDIAELWASSGAHSLAGQLWRIYLLHRVASNDPEGTAELFRIGRAGAPTIHPVVAGVAEPVSPESIAELCDTILRGVFTGDLAIALERASSYCRIMSLGAASLADDRDLADDAHAGQLTTRALRYAGFADDLHAGARRWREGSLD
ncbi:MAG: hypothetical protein J0H64_08440 [Actinobacteria bacterium]|nr:hypothetical protein [Actinomycetota bacterium]